MSHWHIIGHASELAAEGDFVCLPIEPGCEIAVTRQLGQLFAFDNRCPHRGARIFTELRGNRKSTCAYHGHFVHAGCVQGLPLAIHRGWVLVADRHGGASPEGTFGEGLLGFLGTAPETIAPYSMLTIGMRCHWTVAVENALDYEHVEHVHEGSLATLRIRPVTLMLNPDGSSAHRFASERGKALDRIAAMFMRPAVAFDYVHAHFFPYSCVSSTRGLTYSLQHYLPRADGTTVFLHRMYACAARTDVTAYLEGVRTVNERTFWEDVRVCEITPADHGGPLLGEKESRIAHFRAHCKAAGL